MLNPIFDTLSHFTESDKREILKSGAVVNQDDYLLAWQFLYSYRGSEATFNSYRREIERFLKWTWYVKKKNLKEINRQDAEKYIEFCLNPPKRWIGESNVERFFDKEGLRVPNKKWRPFVINKNKIKGEMLSQKAIQAIFAVLGSFYNFLIQENYTHFNPVSQMRQKSKFLRKYQNKPVIRRLTELEWQYVIKTATKMADENSEYERTLFIMSALYGMYLRISELVATSRWVPMMNHFFKDSNGDFWFRVVGKGNKERIIAVSDAMLAALKRYRKSLNLPALPSVSEQVPLILKRHGRGPIESTRQIRFIVQECFDLSITALQKDGFLEEAENLKEATVHWLRHTGISDDVKIRPREHVRDDAGHSSIAITDKYIDVELRSRHASSKNKVINPD